MPTRGSIRYGAAGPQEHASDEQARRGAVADRRGRADVSGIGAVFLILGVAVFALFAAWTNQPHDPNEFWSTPPPTTGDKALGAAAYLLVPLGALLAGVLAIRAIGVGLVESFIVSGILAGVPTMLMVASGPTYGKVLVLLVGAPALVVLAASMLTNSVRASVIVALFAGIVGIGVYAAYSASVSLGYFVGLAAWVVLPLVAGSFLPRERREGPL